MKIAVVTGASSGMGAEFVRQLARKFDFLDEIWLLARNKSKMEALVDSIHTNTFFRILPCDITKQTDLASYRELLEKNKPSICFLVNSAGFGLIGSFEQMSADELYDMADVNCGALTRVIALSIPYMRNKRSHIVNVCSGSAFLPQPEFAGYAATKSYVLSLSRALNVELAKRGIHVTAVCPGPVDTEFFETAERHAKMKSYKKAFLAKKEVVVAAAIEDSLKGKALSIPGSSMKAFYVLTKLLPHRLLLKLLY